ncbi:hypothetical protein L1887_58421 [Cichorium endivia]|nr:hypothetical protein L1887_58421 [Cichorium endivia]
MQPKSSRRRSGRRGTATSTALHCTLSWQRLAGTTGDSPSAGTRRHVGVQAPALRGQAKARVRSARGIQKKGAALDAEKGASRRSLEWERRNRAISSRDGKLGRADRHSGRASAVDSSGSISNSKVWVSAKRRTASKLISRRAARSSSKIQKCWFLQPAPSLESCALRARRGAKSNSLSALSDSGTPARPTGAIRHRAR